MLVLGGGGYTKTTVARAWTMETGERGNRGNPGIRCLAAAPAPARGVMPGAQHSRAAWPPWIQGWVGTPGPQGGLGTRL